MSGMKRAYWWCTAFICQSIGLRFEAKLGSRSDGRAYHHVDQWFSRWCLGRIWICPNEMDRRCRVDATLKRLLTGQRWVEAVEEVARDRMRQFPLIRTRKESFKWSVSGYLNPVLTSIVLVWGHGYTEAQNGYARRYALVFRSVLAVKMGWFENERRCDAIGSLSLSKVAGSDCDVQSVWDHRQTRWKDLSIFNDWQLQYKDQSHDRSMGGYFAAEEDKGIIYGDVGRGKTHPMVGLCKLLIFVHGTRLFCRVFKVARQLWCLQRRKIWRSYFGRVGDRPHFTIDEIGKGRLTE